ncbi:hypothetical protein FJT64_013351 [Amphibalanus amphitrite]|uniref:Retrotransposon gag domain-containing protein n=1 Tax=Amphibalanus amphitrite TaxID=1232801 RepID=A0A6A4VFN0_AMPAM|nr:hypothetical protein FJT64_013351 [Amphibalanus amphitrite]
MGPQSVLQGGALDFFASLPEQIRGDYQTTKKALAERYSQLQNPLQAQVELARACQQPGETASDFADRLRQLGRLAHPRVAPDDPTLDASLRGLFICGLRDAGLKSVLCNKSPDSMDAAVRIAREFKSQQTALVAMQQFGTAAGAHEAMTPQVMVASSGGSGVNQAVALQSLERRMDDIQQALQQLCTDGPRRQNTGGLAEDGDGGARRGTAFPHPVTGTAAAYENIIREQKELRARLQQFMGGGAVDSAEHEKLCSALAQLENRFYGMLADRPQRILSLIEQIGASEYTYVDGQAAPLHVCEHCGARGKRVP